MMKPLFTTIELSEESFGFSAAHFTIFSPTHRERLHGHNYQVKVKLVAEMNPLGIAFDYGIYKKKLIALALQLNSYLLLPGNSPVLQIKEMDSNYEVLFHEDRLVFLKKDVLILPIRNITIEELSSWFLQQLLQDHETLTACKIHAITVSVSNGRGRWGSAHWPV